MEELVKEKATGATSLEDFMKKLQKPRVGVADGPGRDRGQNYRRRPSPTGA
jgi:hypothetical protein